MCPGRIATRNVRSDHAYQHSTAPPAPQPLLTWRILLVDDEPTQRLIMARLLKRAGYRSKSRATEEALAKIDTGDFQLMITDWEMPEMDGIALCRAARKSGSQGLHLHDPADCPRRDRARRDRPASGRRRLSDQARIEPELIARLSTGKRIVTLERSLRAAKKRTGGYRSPIR